MSLEKVTVWIDRPKGEREANVGTYWRWKQPGVYDEKYAQSVLSSLSAYDGLDAASAREKLTPKATAADKSGVLADLATALAATASRLTRRHRENADVGLADMTVHVRAEETP